MTEHGKETALAAAARPGDPVEEAFASAAAEEGVEAGAVAVEEQIVG